MNLGLPEITIIVVILIVIIALAKVFGDKRYLKRSGRNNAASKDSNREA